jgi:hypothetical protein
VFPRQVHHLLEIQQRHARHLRVGAPPVIQQAQDAHAPVRLPVDARRKLLQLEDIQRLGVADPVDQVVLGPQFRIPQHPVGIVQLHEQRRIARARIVGMIARRQHAVHALDRLRLRVGADLEHFVIIDKIVGRTWFHKPAPPA